MLAAPEELFAVWTPVVRNVYPGPTRQVVGAFSMANREVAMAMFPAMSDTNTVAS
jgi:hypothetical protein